MKFKTREEINQELEKKGYANLNQYYLYDSDKLGNYIKNNLGFLYEFNNKGYNVLGFNIYKDDVDNQYEKDLIDVSKKEEKLQRYILDIIKTINDLASGNLSMEKFIRTKKISVELLIEANRKYGYNKRLNLSLLRKKEYNAQVRPFVIDDYLKTTHFKDENGEEYIPSVDLIKKAKQYAIEKDILMNDVNMRMIIAKMINGELSFNNEFTYDYLEAQRKKIATINNFRRKVRKKDALAKRLIRKVQDE
mgnify:CR=1 FL=1